MKKIGVLVIFMLVFCLMSFFPTVTADENGFEDLKLAVTPLSYDDMGYILTNLGYAYTEIQVTDLNDLTTLSAYDVVFINCAGDIEQYAEISGPVIKSFVEAGGVVYASDWAHFPIDVAFDDAITFYDEDSAVPYSKIGETCTVTGSIVDPGFEAFLGVDTASIEFDLPSWVVIESVPSTTTQHLAGTVGTTQGSMYVPITVSFDQGDGSVIYTSFHYEAQESDIVETLMEYLVFKAVTETITSTIKQDLIDDGYNITHDIRGGVDEGETKTYDIEINESGTIKVVLDWYGETLTLSANVLTPGGATIQASGTKPKYIEIAEGAAGSYKVSVTGDDVSTDNEPFTLAVGTGGTPSGDDDGSTTTPPSGGGTPGFELLTMLVALMVALILIRKKK